MQLAEHQLTTPDRTNQLRKQNKQKTCKIIQRIKNPLQSGNAIKNLYGATSFCGSLLALRQQATGKW
jgi:hypothetical protein